MHLSLTPSHDLSNFYRYYSREIIWLVMFVCPFVNTHLLESFGLWPFHKKHAVLKMIISDSVPAGCWSFLISRNFEFIEIQQGLCVNALGFNTLFQWNGVMPVLTVKSPTHCNGAWMRTDNALSIWGAIAEQIISRPQWPPANNESVRLDARITVHSPIKIVYYQAVCGIFSPLLKAVISCFFNIPYFSQ